jgi:hypothetical protein
MWRTRQAVTCVAFGLASLLGATLESRAEEQAAEEPRPDQVAESGPEYEVTERAAAHYMVKPEGDGIVLHFRDLAHDIQGKYQGRAHVAKYDDGLFIRKTDGKSPTPDGGVYFTRQGCQTWNKSANRCDQRTREELLMSVGGHRKPVVFMRNGDPGAGPYSQTLVAESAGRWSTVHFGNRGPGQVLWLESYGVGDLIVGHAEGKGTLFRVDAQGVTHTKVLEVTGGADLAEGFEVTGPAGAPVSGLEPGTVVSIDAGGVQPGMLLGQEGTAAAGPVPVALTGRVYVRCDASAGAIRPGDLLTTSERSGHCMRVDDHQRAAGAVLGKAMEPLEDGTGLVLTLVSLQ